MSDRSKCPLASLESVISFSAKDWSIERSDAWVYGVVLGWDDDSLKELSLKFRWNNEDVTRLKMLHRNFKGLLEDKE